MGKARTLGVMTPGDQDHRHVLLAVDLRCRGNPVEAGHRVVGHDQLWAELAAKFDPLTLVRGRPHVVAAVGSNFCRYSRVSGSSSTTAIFKMVIRSSGMRYWQDSVQRRYSGQGLVRQSLPGRVSRRMSLTAERSACRRAGQMARSFGFFCLMLGKLGGYPTSPVG
jgi:hypothetical protein